MKKDVGIAVDCKLNMTHRCDNGLEKVNAMLGCIKRSIFYSAMVRLYSNMSELPGMV